MSLSKKFVFTITAGVMAAGAVLAAVNPESAVTARKAHMQIYAHNLGILGGMARGDMEYDAALAQTAADNLATATGMSQDTYWVPGTAVGEIDDSKALPAIWENMDDFEAKMVTMNEAAVAMQGAAGDLESLRGAMQGIGAGCGGCHEDYRQSD